MRIAQRTMGLAVWVWVAILFLVPVALMPIGAFICHQRPERSFFASGMQMAVCARCAGLYAGAAVAVPLALLRATALDSGRARAIALLAGLPTLMTWSLEFANIAAFSNAIRFVAALPMGFAAAWLVLGVMAEN